MPRETKAQLLRSLDWSDRSYIEAALWASMDNRDDTGGDPLDKNYAIADLTIDALRTMRDEWRAFRDANRADIEATEELRHCKDGYDYLDCAAHDFWLTRNGHGTGFWDRGYPEELGDRLTEAAKKCGERNLYVQRGRIGVE